MKTLLIAFLALLGVNFIAPEAQARDRDRGRYYNSHRHNNGYYSTRVYRTYPRYYRPYRSVYYSNYYPGYYNYYPRTYYTRPNVVLSFGF
jgi:hypothetical protein